MTGFIYHLGKDEFYLNLKRAIRIRCGDSIRCKGVGTGRFHYIAEFADGSEHSFTADEKDLSFALGTIIPAQPGSQATVVYQREDHTEFEETHQIIAWVITHLNSNPIPITLMGGPEDTMGSNGRRMSIKMPDGADFEFCDRSD
jgi:hypothetical protein